MYGECQEPQKEKPCLLIDMLLIYFAASVFDLFFCPDFSSEEGVAVEPQQTICDKKKKESKNSIKMSSGTLKFTIPDLEKRITYPPRIKKVEASEPHRSAVSRKLLEDYRVAALESNRQRLKNQMFQPLRAQNSATMAALTPSSTALIAQAEQAQKADRLDDAVACLSEALRITDSAKDPGAYTLINTRLGLLYVDRESYQEALESFGCSIRVDPMISENYLHRAGVYLLLQEPRKAFVEYEKYFKLEEPDKALLVRCGKCALDDDLLDRAEFYFRKALSKTDETDAPNDAYAYYNLGELEEKRGNDDAAIALYKRVMQIDPSFPDPYRLQAEDELRAGNYPMALHLFEALAKMMPDNNECFLRLADTYELIGDEFSSSILMCLTKAVELEQPQSVRDDTLVRRGRLLADVFKDLDRAISDFSTCLESNKVHADALLHRANAYRERNDVGDLQAAVEDYMVLTTLPHVAWATKAVPFQVLASHYFLRKEFSEASRCFSLAVVGGVTLNQQERLRQAVATGTTLVAQNDVNFEENYDPRGWPVKADEKGKKSDPSATKGWPVVTPAYAVVDRIYQSLRDLEPTMHGEYEHDLIAIWRPFREEVERRKEEMEGIRLGKKPKKGK